MVSLNAIGVRLLGTWFFHLGHPLVEEHKKDSAEARFEWVERSFYGKPQKALSLDIGHLGL